MFGEGAFLVIALALVRLTGVRPGSNNDVSALLLGAVAGLAMAAAGVALMRSRASFLRPMQTEFEQVIGVFANASTADLALVAGMAGICEEALFRGFAQTWATPALGTWGSVVAVAVVFGVAHAVSLRYAVFAAVLGVILGGVYALTGSLFGVMLAHALYDFVVLYWALKRPRPGSAEPPL